MFNNRFANVLANVLGVCIFPVLFIPSIRRFLYNYARKGLVTTHNYAVENLLRGDIERALRYCRYFDINLRTLQTFHDVWPDEFPPVG